MILANNNVKREHICFRLIYLFNEAFHNTRSSYFDHILIRMNFISIEEI